jgi:hypothetical protein
MEKADAPRVARTQRVLFGSPLQASPLAVEVLEAAAAHAIHYQQGYRCIHPVNRISC